MNLIATSQDLSRKLYASLPLGYRVASLLLKLADYRPADFGRFMYNMFVMVGIQGMPQVEGREPRMPKSPRDVAVPPGYGAEFGKRAFGLAMKLLAKYGLNPGDADELLQQVGMKFLDRGTFSSLHGHLSDAEKFVFMTIRNEVINLWRAKKVRKHQDLVDDDDKEIQHFIRDPRSLERPDGWHELSKILDPQKLHQIEEALHRTNPDAEKYFSLLMEGHNDLQIVEHKMLKSLQDRPISYQGWMKSPLREKLLGDIRNTVQKALVL